MIGRPLAKSIRFFGDRIIKPIKEYFIPRQFKFISLTPQQNLEFKSFPMEEWRVKKQENEQTDKIKLACVFIIFFFIADWVYTMKHNENVMYYYYIQYPLAMKLLENIIPKEKYQIPQVWDRLLNAIFNTHQTQKIKDLNVQKLKTQLAEIDQKLI